MQSIIRRSTIYYSIIAFGRLNFLQNRSRYKAGIHNYENGDKNLLNSQ